MANFGIECFGIISHKNKIKLILLKETYLQMVIDTNNYKYVKIFCKNTSITKALLFI